MSIIYSYPEQGKLNANDMLIGTSAEKVGGKQTNVTRNFSIQQIADFIGDGETVFNPTASDFQIGVFNQGGTKLTGSIMSQDVFPNGTSITVAGDLAATGNITTPANLTAYGIVTLGSQSNLISLNSPTKLAGSIQDANGVTGNLNQILVSSLSGVVSWADYARLSGIGTGGVITKWTGSGASLSLGDSIMTETDAAAPANARITIAGDVIPGTGTLTLGNTTDRWLEVWSATSNTTGVSTATTFSGDLNGTINTVTTGVTKPNATDDTTVATTAFVKNVVGALPGGLIFKGTWNADTNAPTLTSGGGEVSEGTTTSILANSLVDSAATFITDGVSTSDRVRVETSSGVEFADVTAVVSETELTLSANIVGATGQSYIVEALPFLTEGNYYIVSVDGATDLNGVTDWKVGDWAVASSTNVWQKIDNSSVLSGQGTGGYIPIWTGSGDSVTLGNSETIFNDIALDRVGIGTITPAAKLEVVNTTGEVALQVMGGTTDASGDFATEIRIKGNKEVNAAARNIGGIKWYNNEIASADPDDDEIASIIADQAIASNGEADIEFNVLHCGGMNERMRILSDGQIKFNTYDDSSQSFIETPSYMLGVNSTGEVVKLLGSDVPGSISGSGTVGYVPIFTAAGAIGNSETIFNDTTNDFIGIGTITPGSELDVNGTIAFGSLKDTGENITITKFVDEADGLINNDNDTTIPTSAAVIDYVTATPGITNFNAIGFAMNYMSRVHDDGGVVEGMEQVMINTEKLILS